MKVRFIAWMAAFTLILSSCAGKAVSSEPTDTNDTVAKNNVDNSNEEKDKGNTLDYELLKPAAFYTSDYTPLNINANVPDIKVETGLSNIENISDFGNLSETQREMIEKNGFVVNPTNMQQMFYIYEDNTYNLLPSFITTDSVLQLYHIFYDYSLREVEAEKLYPEIKELNKNMTEILLEKYNALENEEDKTLVGKTLAYFAVCEKLAGEETQLPTEINQIVEGEYANIKLEGANLSPTTGAQVDYSLFKVRGHYTRSDELKEYFALMSMYGVMPFNFYNPDKSRNPEGAYMAIIATGALDELEKEKGMSLWEDVYTITEFYVGSSDDITPLGLSSVIKAVYGKMPEVNEIESGIDSFYNEIDKINNSKISNPVSGEAGACFRFMGQRYIPDSEILGRLSSELRPFPSGLDVMAVLGSERAEELLDNIYKPQNDWPEYKNEYNKVKREFSQRSIYDRTKNIYATWLFSLESLNQSFPEGYPNFMRNTAWEDKSLSTSLGSWSELRHDTILYGAQSGVECGGGEEPPELLGYVEPNPELYNRLIWLTNQTKEGLSQRGALSESMGYKCENILELLEFLKSASIKELAGEDLTYEEYQTILNYGGYLEYLSSSIMDVYDWYSVKSDTDKSIAQIADVHSAMEDGTVNYLETGVGNAAEIYVAVPISGKLYLTRGAVFDYFEFKSGERLTDEEWQESLTNPPDRPPFVGNYMQEEEGAEIVTPPSPYSSGC